MQQRFRSYAARIYLYCHFGASRNREAIVQRVKIDFQLRRRKQRWRAAAKVNRIHSLQAAQPRARIRFR